MRKSYAIAALGLALVGAPASANDTSVTLG